MHKIKNNPSENDDATNKEYVDSKSKTISWADYQALSDEEKNNGTTYFIPDMPVDTSGNIIGEVEYGNYIINSNPSSFNNGDKISFELNDGNLIIDSDGYIILTANKIYDIKATVRCNYSDTNGYIKYILKDSNGNELSSMACDACNLYSSTINYGCSIPLHLVIKPGTDLKVAIFIYSQGNVSLYELPYCNMNIVEIPSIQACINVSDEHIAEVSEVYSTDETVIGKWIDGKPLYRKVISLNCPTCTDNGIYADARTDVSDLNIDYIMFKYVNIYTKNDSIIPYNGFNPNESAKLGGQVWYYITDKVIYARHTRTDFNDCPITAIIEYTKTSD